MSFIEVLSKAWKIVENGLIIDTKYFHLEFSPFNFKELEYNFYIEFFGFHIGINFGKAKKKA